MDREKVNLGSKSVVERRQGSLPPTLAPLPLDHRCKNAQRLLCSVRPNLDFESFDLASKVMPSIYDPAFHCINPPGEYSLLPP